jgi:hypothetical protein
LVETIYRAGADGFSPEQPVIKAIGRIEEIRGASLSPNAH